MTKILAYALNRIAGALPTLVIVSIFVFALQKLLPGDPVLAMLGEDRDPLAIASLREKYHLDDTLVSQYLRWAWDVLHGDLGISLRSHQPVVELIFEKLPVTFELALLALAFAIAIGVPAGIVAAAKKGSGWDHAASAIALWGLSIPNFWFGILLILFVSVQLKWLPSSGHASFFTDPAQNLKTMVMPAFVLGNALAASLMRHTRSAMLAVLKSDYVRTARSKGLLEPRVVLKHAFRNALVPIVTLTALLFGELMAGAVLTEQIFSIPGFGKLIVDAVFNRDYAVVQGVVLFTALGFILMNLAADLAYFFLNPRLRTA